MLLNTQDPSCWEKSLAPFESLPTPKKLQVITLLEPTSMADQLDMNQLSLNDSKHANGPPGGGRSYIPPHMRQSSRQMPPPMNDGMDGSAWGPPPYVDALQPFIENADIRKSGANGTANGGPPPPEAASSWAPSAAAPNFQPRGPPPGGNPSWSGSSHGVSGFDPGAYGKPRGGGGFSGGYSGGGGSYGGGGGGGSSRGSGDGTWKDGKHIPGPPNTRVERELFGTGTNDPSKTHTGINFEKYDDIPVEASAPGGQSVPEPVTRFSNPPLDVSVPEVLDFRSTSAARSPTTPNTSQPLLLLRAKADRF